MHLGCAVCELQNGTAGDAITILLENEISRSATSSIRLLAELSPEHRAHNSDGDCLLCKLIDEA